MMQEIVSRDEAKSLGHKRYFTGKACSRGHINERFVSTHQCVDCLKFHNHVYYSSDPEKFRAKSRDWTAGHKESVAERSKKYRQDNLEMCKAASRDSANRYYASNKEKVRANSAKWQRENPDKVRAYGRASARRNAQKRKEYIARNIEKRRENARRWVKNNRDYATFRTASYRAQMKCAMPPWADLLAIREVYRRARLISIETGIKHEVDHIIPLVSKIVCGLHIAANLQILPARDNRLKSNKFVVTIS